MQGNKWLIHGTKHHKDNQLQSLDLPDKKYSRYQKNSICELEEWKVKSNNRKI